MKAARWVGFWYGIIWILGIVGNTHAQTFTQKPFGVGVIIGDPTGISVKYWKTTNQAYQFGGAWSFIGEGTLHLHGDFILHNNQLLGQAENGVMLYYGLGIRIKLEKNFRMGFRIPLGIDFAFRQAPLDFFIEVVPIMDLFPATQLKMNGGFGLRYFF